LAGVSNIPAPIMMPTMSPTASSMPKGLRSAVGSVAGKLKHSQDVGVVVGPQAKA
jgi:hypothetical protein